MDSTAFSVLRTIVLNDHRQIRIAQAARFSLNQLRKFSPESPFSSSARGAISSGLPVIFDEGHNTALVAGCELQCCDHGVYLKRCDSCGADYAVENRRILGDALSDRLVDTATMEPTS